MENETVPQGPKGEVVFFGEEQAAALGLKPGWYWRESRQAGWEARTGFAWEMFE